MKLSSISASKRVIYKTIDGWNLPMDIYFPKDYDGTQQYPAVVCIHGGAWHALTDKGRWKGDFMNLHAQSVAQKGAIGIAISYRSLEKEGQPTLYDLYSDCRSAIRYLRIHSKELMINPNKIAAWGDSAGAHLAACLGTIEGYDSIGEDIKVSARANLVVACNPIMDLTDPKWIDNCKDKPNISEEELKEKALGLSPLYNIDENTLPFLLMHGQADVTVAFRHSEEFYHKMCEQKIPCKLILIPKASHAFILWNYKTKTEQVDGYVEQIHNYLCDNGYINNEKVDK